MKRYLYSVRWAALFLLWSSGAGYAASPEMIVEDFEGGITRWKGAKGAFTVETETVKEGLQAARFLLDEKAETSFKFDPTDWSDYAGVSFWIYNPKENPAVIGMALTSENSAQQGWVYFFRKIELNWSGWRHFRVRKADFTPQRDPSWATIKGISFSVGGWQWTNPSPGDSIIIDDIRLLSEAQMNKE